MIQESGQKAFPQVKIRSLRQLPMRVIDFSQRDDRDRHDRLVTLVDHMLGLTERLLAASTGHELTLIERQIDTTDRQIDQLVYELYRLTDEEIEVVEKT